MDLIVSVPEFSYLLSIGIFISRALADIVCPLAGTIEYNVNNFEDFGTCMTVIMIKEDEMFNSHDVLSLFINTPMRWR